MALLLQAIPSWTIRCLRRTGIGWTILESSNNYLEFALKIRKFMDNKSYKKLREAVNKTEWTKHSGATKVNAYYNNQENSI
ncbi:hypothetical protein ILUMI_17133, partial [Ignelater luminosus]